MYLFLRRIFVVLSVTAVCKTVCAQQKLNNYLPASPNAASLSAAGGMGVNLSTGSANISIPIYTAKSGDLELPVTINYNAQGIKVNDLAGSVGLGWALNSGGIISKQNLRGPDCGLTNIGRSLFLSQFESNKNKFTLIADSAYQYSAPISTIGDNMYDFLYRGVYGDKQSDLYSFNFMGYSGRFFLEGPSTAFVIPYQPLQVYFETRDSSFTLTTSNGVKYFFGKFEIGENTTDSRVLVESTCDSDMESDTITLTKFPQKVVKRDITAWYLTKIIAPNSNDSIVINYENSPNVITDKSYRYGVFPGTVQVNVYGTEYVYIPPPSNTPESNLAAMTAWAAEAQRDRKRRLNDFYLGSLAARVKSNAEQLADYIRTGNGTYIQIQNASNNYYNAVDQYQFQSNYLDHSLESDWELGQMVNLTSIGAGQSSFLNSRNVGGYSANHDFGVSNDEYTLETNSKSIAVKSIEFRDGRIEFTNKYDRSDHPGARIEEIILKKKTGAVYTELNRFKLTQDYFVSLSKDHLTSATDRDNYRLKLLKMQQLDAAGQVVSEHRFDYNALSLPPRKSYSQDYWGYYNMHGNKSLIQSTMRSAKVMGNSRRDVNEEAMQACMLKRIYYPTGGYTDFTFEPHLFTPVSLSETDIPEAQRPVETIEAFVSAYGLQRKIIQQFIPPNDQRVKIKVQLSAMDVSGARSKVILRDQTLNQVILSYTSSPSSKISYGYDGVAAIDTLLKKGHLYEVEANLPTTYVEAGVVPKDSIQTIGKIAKINIDYTLGTQVMYAGGGLRVANVKKYDSNGGMISSEQYKYGKNESGLGIQLFGKDAFGPFTTQQKTMSASSDNIWGKCTLTESQSSYMDFSTLYELSGYGGSPVIYDKVTKYYSYNTAISNGKTEYEFTAHQPMKIDAKADNYLSFYEDWKDGLLLSEKNYAFSNNSYLPVNEAKNTYKEFSKKRFINPRVSIDQSFTGCKDLNKLDMLPGVFFKVMLDNFNSSSLLLTETAARTFVNGDTMKFVLDKSVYEYDTLRYDQLKKVTKIDSKGETNVVVNKYLFEIPYGQDVIINKMQDKFMVGTVLESSASLGSKLLGKTTRKYKILANGYAVLDEQEMFNGANVSTFKTKFSAYDQVGHVLSLVNEGGSVNSVLWKNDYPVANVKNADYTEIFYEGFEDHVSGSSTYAFSGNKGFSGSYAVPFVLPSNTTKSFLITYWKQEINIWRLVTAAYTGPVTISGIVDEVRVYPKGSDVKTITFSPLVGVTSEMQNNGDVLNYFYDNAQRLNTVRNKDGNILKQISYNITGVSAITVSTIPNWQSTGLKQCVTNDDQEYTGEQIVQEKDMNTASTSYNTTRWVSLGNSGACGAPVWNLMRGTERCKSVSGTYTGEEEAQFKDGNPLSGTYNTIKWKVTGKTERCQCDATPGFRYDPAFGKCKAATKIYTDFTQLPDGTYSCYYYYEYYDHTTGPTMTEIRTTAPTIYCTVTVNNTYHPVTTYNTLTVTLTSAGGQVYTIGPVHDAQSASLGGIPNGIYTIEVSGGLAADHTCVSVCKPDGSGVSLPKNGTYYKFLNFNLKVTSLSIQQAVEGCYPF